MNGKQNVDGSWNVVGIVGLGFLGRGVAACLVAHGFRVVAQSRSAETRRAAEQYVQQAMEELVAHAGFPPSLPGTWRDRCTFSDEYKDLSGAEFVIESVAEDIEIKNHVFDALEGCLAPGVPIATNTSSLPISQLASRRRVPERFLGMHWAEPAYATRFLELIRGEQTSDAVFDRALDLARRAGKQPSIVRKDIPAFIVNRLGYAMYREAFHLLEQGVADVATIDRSFRNAVGLWASFAGPFRWIDLTGGPALYGRTMANVFPSLSNSHNLPRPMLELMQADARGVKNGRGFYSYTSEEARQWEERFRRFVWTVRKWTDELPLEDE